MKTTLNGGCHSASKHLVSGWQEPRGSFSTFQKQPAVFQCGTALKTSTELESVQTALLFHSVISVED